MKRLIIFLLLFAAIKVAGQTTGYLRFDTVKIMKQNGTCELYIINKTKDTLGILTNVGGGLTQFRKSRVLNDSTIVVGLDTLMIIGGAGGGGGAGSVTSISQGYGIVNTPNPITSTGTIRADTSGVNGLVTRTEFLDSTDVTTQVESPIFVKLRATWPVPDTLAIDTTRATTRDWLYKVVDSTIALLVRVSDTASMLNNYVIGTGGAGRLTFWTATRSIGSDAQMTVDATTNTITVDSLAAYRTHVTQVLVNANDNIITPPDSAHAGGDSYTAGTGATTYDSSHIPYWSRHMGFTVSNYAVGGKGVWWMAKEHILRLSPGHRAMAFQFAGFNDQRRNSSNRRTLNKIIDAYKSVFINQYAATSVAAGNGTGVTRHGTWTTNYDPVSVGGKSAASGAYTTLAGDSIRYSFSGTSVFFTYIGADNSGAGFNYSDSLDIYIDGAFQERIGQNNRWDGVTDGAYDNRRGPGGWFKTGMVSGSHVLTVINRHAGNFCTFDRFGTLVPRQEAMPLYMYHAAYNNLAGFAVSPSNGSIAAVDEVNSKLDSLYATLPTSIYPVYMVPSDQILDTLTDYNADNIHPNNLGHRKLYEGALAEFDPLEGAQDGLLERNEADWFITIGGQRRKILTGSTAADTLAIYASPSAQQTAFININSSSMHTIGGRITVGSTALGTATASFRNIVRNNFVYDTYEFGSRIYHWNRNNAGTDGVATTIGGSSINFSTLAASAETVRATINTTGLRIINNLFIGALSNGAAGTDSLLTITTTETKKIAGNFYATQSALNDTAAAIRAHVSTGTYTPTLTNTTNIASSSVYGTFYYTRIGNTVTVTGIVSIDPTATSTTTQLEISLPIASNLTNFWQLTGQMGTNGGGVSTTDAPGGIIVGSTADDRAVLVFLTGTNSTANDYSIRFTYEVL